MLQTADKWILEIKEKVFPKVVEFVKQNKKWIAISASVLGSSFIIYRLVSKKPSPRSSSKKSNTHHDPQAHRRHSKTQAPHFRDFTIHGDSDRYVSPDMKKKNINFDEITAQSWGNREYSSATEKIDFNAREDSDDWSDFRSETLSYSSYNEERETRNERRASSSSDPDELFFKIFQRLK